VLALDPSFIVRFGELQLGAYGQFAVAAVFVIVLIVLNRLLAKGR
jgi:hypothetical protein